MWVFSTTLLQLSTTDEIRGRVFATEAAIFTITISLSNYLTGIGLDIPGITSQIMTFILAALILIPGIFWLLLLSRWDKWTASKKSPAN